MDRWEGDDRKLDGVVGEYLLAMAAVIVVAVVVALAFGGSS